MHTRTGKSMLEEREFDASLVTSAREDEDDRVGRRDDGGLEWSSTM